MWNQDTTGERGWTGWMGEGGDRRLVKAELELISRQRTFQWPSELHLGNRGPKEDWSANYILLRKPDSQETIQFPWKREVPFILQNLFFKGIVRPSPQGSQSRDPSPSPAFVLCKSNPLLSTNGPQDFCDRSKRWMTVWPMENLQWNIFFLQPLRSLAQKLLNNCYVHSGLTCTILSVLADVVVTKVLAFLLTLVMSPECT